MARLLATQQLASWGWPHGSGVSRAAAVVVAELASNAAAHGRVPGRSFRLRLTMGPGLLLPDTLRIEVADPLGERRPDLSAPVPPAAEGSERGHGLVLVSYLVERCGVLDRPPSGKTVWAEIDL